jgi:hypothetical protein
VTAQSHSLLLLCLTDHQLHILTIKNLIKYQFDIENYFRWSTSGVDSSVGRNGEKRLLATGQLDGAEDGQGFTHGRHFDFSPFDATKLPSMIVTPTVNLTSSDGRPTSTSGNVCLFFSKSYWNNQRSTFTQLPGDFRRLCSQPIRRRLYSRASRIRCRIRRDLPICNRPR